MLFGFFVKYYFYSFCFNVLEGLLIGFLVSLEFCDVVLIFYGGIDIRWINFRYYSNRGLLVEGKVGRGEKWCEL